MPVETKQQKRFKDSQSPLERRGIVHCTGMQEECQILVMFQIILFLFKYLGTFFEN